MYGETGWGCTLLVLNAKVMPRSCEGHEKVNLHKKIPKIVILCLLTRLMHELSVIYMTVVGSFRVKHYFSRYLE